MGSTSKPTKLRNSWRSSRLKTSPTTLAPTVTLHLDFVSGVVLRLTRKMLRSSPLGLSGPITRLRKRFFRREQQKKKYENVGRDAGCCMELAIKALFETKEDARTYNTYSWRSDIGYLHWSSVALNILAPFISLLRLYSNRHE